MAKKILEQEGIHIPVITTLHGTDITLVGNHPAYKPAVEFSINHSDKVTAVSESLKNETFEFFNIKNEIEKWKNKEEKCDINQEISTIKENKYSLEQIDKF